MRGTPHVCQRQGQVPENTEQRDQIGGLGLDCGGWKARQYSPKSQ